jgi:hypothetical protein
MKLAVGDSLQSIRAANSSLNSVIDYGMDIDIVLVIVFGRFSGKSNEDSA